MSTVQRTNFEPVSDILRVDRKDFPLADTTLLNPSNSVALVDGEWMTLNSVGKLVRASTVGTPGNQASSELLYPIWAERGRYDIQAIGKAPVLWMGDWEADTRIYDATAVVGTGLAITAIGQPVKVATITLGGRNYTGLVGHGGSADTSKIVGYVTKLPSANGGKLRIRNRAR